nr:uncharacterized mitochondrial protein AtMg00810-like [Tanacetum cinerariifolium]
MVSSANLGNPVQDISFLGVAKIPILDTGKFEQWQFRIQQYLQHEHYDLWEVIEFGDSYKVPTNTNSVDSSSKDGRTVTVTTDDMQKKKNDVKARTTLLLSLPDEHQFRGKTDKTLFIKRYKRDILLVQVYVDDIIFGLTKKELCNAFERLMHKKFQMSSMGELTFFLGLQVKQKKDEIFISQDKYVAKILKKFGFTKFKTASTPMETQNPIYKDKDGEEVDVHMYRLMIGSLMYLISSRPNIMFAVCAYARYQVNPKVSHLYAVKRIFSSKLMLLDITYYCWVNVNAVEDGKKIIITEASVRRDLQLADEEGVNCLPDSTILEQPALMAHKEATRKVTQVPQSSDSIEHVADEVVHKELGDSLVRAATTAFSLGAKCQEAIGDNTAQTRIESVSKHSNDSLLARGNTLRSNEDRMKLNELMDLCTNLQIRVLDLEKTKTSQHNEIVSWKRRVKKLEKRNRSKTHKMKRLYKERIEAVDQDDADKDMLDVDVLGGEEVFAEAGLNENVDDIVNVAQDSIATTTITTEELTLAQALEALKTSKPKVKGIVIHEQKEPEEHVKPKKKDQIMLDEEVAKRLQDKFDEEERLAREKAKKEKEANIAFIETWNDIQEKINADYQLAKRLQAQKQEELSDAEMATLFQQRLEKRRKHFVAKRAEEKRNKPPTQAQHRKIMCTYLKNMEGYKLNDLKLKEFDSIKEMFDKAFRRVNTFVDYRTKLVKGKKESRRRANTREYKEVKGGR